MVLEKKLGITSFTISWANKLGSSTFFLKGSKNLAAIFTNDHKTSEMEDISQFAGNITSNREEKRVAEFPLWVTGDTGKIDILTLKF